MKTSLARLCNAAVFAITLGASALGAATTSTNYSDLWWNAGEPGWGLNISQQADSLFATFFVYGDGGQAVWYSVTLAYQSTGANGVVIYGGPLYQTSGPAQGTTYNPALLKYRQVGDATIEFGDDAHGLLHYSADGVLVVKSIERQTFAADSLLGSYIGSTSDVTFNCKSPSRNGLVTTDPGPFTITQDGDQVKIQFPTCAYTGSYTQQGQIGRVDGFYFCTNLANGAITFTGMRTEKGGIVGTYAGADSSCEFHGNIGGMRVLQ